MGYLPIDFVSKINAPAYQEGERYIDFLNKTFLERIFHLDAVDEAAFVKYFCCLEWMCAEYEGECRGLQDALISEAMQQLFLAQGYKTSDFIGGSMSYCSEIRDFFFSGEVFDLWDRNKQVYKMDPEFAHALLTTDHVYLYKECIRHLPVNTFYIDLSTCKEFLPIHGAFVHVYDAQTYCTVDVYMITYDMVYFSWYFNCVYTEDGAVEAVFDRAALDSIKQYSPLTVEESNAFSCDIQKIDRQKLAILVVQLLNYIGSSRPDIIENPQTKVTYRPYVGTPKRKFSEVRQYDVGVRFGKRIKVQIKERKKTHALELEVAINHAARKHHASPKPHFRAAHWHTYWTGTGRTVREVLWLEPTFVGGSLANDVVIHHVG